MTIKGLVCDDVFFDDMLVGRDYCFKLSSYVNDGNTDVGVASFSLKDVKGNSLPTGFKLLSDGTIIGTANDLGTMSFVVEVRLPGYAVTEATVTMRMYDIYDDETEGVPDKPIDYESMGNDEGCNSSAASTAIIPIAVTLIAGIAFVVIKTIKSKNNGKE